MHSRIIPVSNLEPYRLTRYTILDQSVQARIELI